MNNLPRARHPGDMTKILVSRLVAKMDTIDGLTEIALLDRLSHLAHMATKRAIVYKDGHEVLRTEIEEPAVQLAATKEALQLRAAYPAKQVELTGSIKVEELHELAVRFEELPADRLAQIVDAEAVVALPAAVAEA